MGLARKHELDHAALAVMLKQVPRNVILKYHVKPVMLVQTGQNGVLFPVWGHVALVQKQGQDHVEQVVLMKKQISHVIQELNVHVRHVLGRLASGLNGVIALKHAVVVPKIGSG